MRGEEGQDCLPGPDNLLIENLEECLLQVVETAEIASPWKTPTTVILCDGWEETC